MSKYQGTVVVTTTYENVEVEADNEEKATEALEAMERDALVLADPNPSEDVMVEDLELMDGEEEEDED